MRLLRLISLIALCLALLFSATIAVIRAQPYSDQTIRDILQPEGCHMPCFMGIRPGITQMREATAILGLNPWIDSISSHIDSGCCSIATTWRWNGKQPPILDNGDNAVYFNYDPNKGTQTVQNIALHTRMETGYVILLLGAWPKDNSGALRGLGYAYVEMYYPQNFAHVTTTVTCPLTRWRLWKAPMTLTLNTDSWSPTGMKRINEVC